MTSMTLISFDLCPFVQRAVLLLLDKGVDFEVKYIDLANKPAWFLEISPLGKVPVLQVGEEVIFESAVIVEYLDEVHPPSLHPADPILKAQHRAWTEFASGLFMAQYQLSMAEEPIFKEKLNSLTSLLQRLEAAVTGPYFAGDQLHLVDYNFTPFFHRVAVLEKRGVVTPLEGLPKLQAWSAQLLNLDKLAQSVPADFEQKYIEYIQKSGKHLASLIPS